MKNAPLKYALKTWQTAVFLAPLIIVISSGLTNHQDSSDVLSVFAFGVVAGMVFSAPSALLFWLASYLITQQAISWKYKRIILSVIGVALTLLAFMLYASGDMPGKSLLSYLLIYATIIVSGVWIYQLQPISKRQKLTIAGKALYNARNCSSSRQLKYWGIR